MLLLFALHCCYCRELYDAAAIGDVDRVLCAMAHGADLSWSNEAEGSNTAAHQVTHLSQRTLIYYYTAYYTSIM
jgi:hypothetical protein